jgi:signal transduction histidine kinase
LACWAVAAVDPQWFLEWWRTTSSADRRRRELNDLGAELPDLGRTLAERWACPQLVIDAAWLYHPSSSSLIAAASEPARIRYIQEASHWVEQTPWSLDHPADAGRMPTDPRIKIVVAEVQARSSGDFVAADSTIHEERASRHCARLEIQLRNVRTRQARTDRLLTELAKTKPPATLDEWATAASLAWCAEPAVTAARFVGNNRISNPTTDTRKDTPAIDPPPHSPAPAARPPALILPVRSAGRSLGELHIWTSPGTPTPPASTATSLEWQAWEAWAALLAGRAEAETRLRQVLHAHREHLLTEDARLPERMLEALAEFAAGAGHELNNPLAVIAGRAQLLLARTSDIDATRSLQVIQAQVSRAHQMLRDLMFVARPPRPVNRLCRPTELLRASLRDFQQLSAQRGVRLLADLDDTVPPTWADPDALRHVGDVLLKNALQATPEGGKIQVRSTTADGDFIWMFTDSGHGIDPLAAAHLFDPFFCGRQAGRGLGLGLPRAATIVQQNNGRIDWTSEPGHPTIFTVHIPIRSAPHATAA